MIIGTLSFMCISVPFPGEYGFEIAFEQQNKDTKSITWTVCVQVFNTFI